MTTPAGVPATRTRSGSRPAAGARGGGQDGPRRQLPEAEAPISSAAGARRCPPIVPAPGAPPRRSGRRASPSRRRSSRPGLSTAAAIPTAASLLPCGRRFARPGAPAGAGSPLLGVARLGRPESGPLESRSAADLRGVREQVRGHARAQHVGAVRGGPTPVQRSDRLGQLVGVELDVVSISWIARTTCFRASSAIASLGAAPSSLPASARPRRSGPSMLKTRTSRDTGSTVRPASSRVSPRWPRMVAAVSGRTSAVNDGRVLERSAHESAAAGCVPGRAVGWRSVFAGHRLGISLGPLLSFVMEVRRGASFIYRTVRDPPLCRTARHCPTSAIRSLVGRYRRRAAPSSVTLPVSCRVRQSVASASRVAPIASEYAAGPLNGGLSHAPSLACRPRGRRRSRPFRGRGRRQRAGCGLGPASGRSRPRRAGGCRRR